MEQKMLMNGNQAIAEAAIQAGCRYFFGYPITPQTEIPEYMSKRLPEVGGVFVQAESEISAINMVYGAAGAGGRAMTSSSSPGISLKQEGISYIAASRIPCLIVNIMRAGPGLGGILPSQSDYYQAVKGGGHGDYRIIVFAPNTVQECIDLVMQSFDIAERYRIPVMLLADGMLGQMMEPVQFKPYIPEYQSHKHWVTDGTRGKRKKNIISSLYIEPEQLERENIKRFKQYEIIEKEQVKVEMLNCDDADIIFVAYGITSRIVKAVIQLARQQGIKAGMIRPITLWPFPMETFANIAKKAKAFLTVEMSMGQMLDDVKIAVQGKAPVYFYGRTGGMVPKPEEILERLKQIFMEVN